MSQNSHNLLQIVFMVSQLLAKSKSRTSDWVQSLNFKRLSFQSFGLKFSERSSLSFNPLKIRI